MMPLNPPASPPPTDLEPGPVPYSAAPTQTAAAATEPKASPTKANPKGKPKAKPEPKNKPKGKMVVGKQSTLNAFSALNDAYKIKKIHKQLTFRK